MKRICLLLCLHAGVASASDPACTPLPLVSLHRPEVIGNVTAPGSYCLGRDITRAPQFDIHAGRFKSAGGVGLVQIACSDEKPCTRLSAQDRYQIDLQGHSLVATAKNTNGVNNTSGGLQVSIRNGRIEAPGDRYPNSGIYLRGQLRGTMLKVDGWKCSPSEPACADVPAAKSEGKEALVYEASNYLIDRVTIRSGWSGVYMGGGNNTLRNSVIEVDGRIGVYQFGPGAIIENNTIIIHGKGDRTEFDAALKLRDAHGTVVRNNKFIFRGGLFTKATAAINLLDSKDVVIEGNTFEGFDQVVRVNGDSTHVVR